MSLTSSIKMRGLTTVCVFFLVGAGYCMPRAAREAPLPAPGGKENADPKLARPLPMAAGGSAQTNGLVPPPQTPASFSGLPPVPPSGALPLSASPLQGSNVPLSMLSQTGSKDSESKVEPANPRLNSLGQFGPFGQMDQMPPMGQRGPMGQMGPMGQIPYRDGTASGLNGPMIFPAGQMSQTETKPSMGQLSPLGQMPSTGQFSPMGQLPPGGQMPPMGQFSPMGQLPPGGQMPTMPSMAQFPSMEQLPQNGQLPSMGRLPRMPPTGQFSPMGQLPPGGQMPPMGQFSPMGQMPPMGQFSPMGQMPPMGQFSPMGQMPPMGQFSPMGQIPTMMPMMNGLQSKDQFSPFATTAGPEDTGSASGTEVAKDSSANDPSTAFQSFMSRKNTGFGPSQFDSSSTEGVPPFALLQSRLGGSTPAGMTAEGPQTGIPPQLQMLLAQAQMQGIPPQILLQQLQMQRMAAQMPPTSQLSGQMTDMPSAQQIPSQNPLTPGMLSPSLSGQMQGMPSAMQVPGQNPFMPGMPSAMQVPGQNPLMPGMPSAMQVPGQNPLMPGMPSPIQLPGQMPDIPPATQMPSQLNPMMPGMPPQELMRLQGMPSQMEPMNMPTQQAQGSQMPPYLTGMGLPPQDIPTEKPAAEVNPMPSPFGLSGLPSEAQADQNQSKINLTANIEQQSLLSSLLPGPVQLRMTSIQDMMAFEDKMQRVRRRLLKSFYTDLAAYQTLAQYIQQRMVLKLALLHLMETRMAMPIRGSLAMALTSSLPVAPKSA